MFVSAPRPFEARLRRLLLGFALLPTLLLLGGATWALASAAQLAGRLGAWEQLAASGRAVLEGAERSPDPRVRGAADRHREQLSGSLTLSRRWGYLIRRVSSALPVFALVLLGGSALVALRASRRIARELSRPVLDLVGWAARVGRGEPLPTAAADPSGESVEFGKLRGAFRSMTDQLAEARRRDLEHERVRAQVLLSRHVAHELKNPLTPIRFAIRVLQARTEGWSEQDREALEVLDAESNRLDEVARAFAQFGRLPEGPVCPVDLHETLDYLLRAHGGDGVTTEVRIEPAAGWVAAQPDALERALRNVVLNAVEAMRGVGRIEVAASAVDGGSEVELRIRDSGPGIPSPLLPHIWEPDVSGKQGGTGLGLASVRSTVQALGGQVAARNHPDGGAEFVLRLPAAPAMPAGVAP